ncbi:MAG: 1-acyl-sn-glycerol-3-phosphate acyltransferase [Myxococcota bacterium]|jgi:1-acyl-sn-glycerol-3-phosphate acyltransferase
MPQPEPNRRLRQLFWLFATTLLGVSFIPLVRLRAHHWRRVPRKGGVLIIANHTTFFDPVLVSWAARRRTHGVGTDQMLRVPFLGRLIPWLSVISFAKGMKDRAAMTEIGDRISDGGVVLLFPEGNRSWTGRMQPIKDSTGRLAKRLGCTVSFCRMTTAHFHWPRWARYPRLVPIHIEFLPTKIYDDSFTDAEVTADLVAKVAVDPNTTPLPRFSWGFRVAWGLPKFLWACPSCFALGTVTLVDNSRIGCSACQGVWRVDLTCRLHAEHDGTQTTVDLVYYQILDHFGALPVADTERFADDGEVLVGAQTRVELVHRGIVEPEVLGEGTMTVYNNRLTFDAMRPEDSFSLDYSEIQAVLMQIGSKLQVRTEARNYQIRPSRYSINLWKHFLSAHFEHAKRTTGGN